MRFQDPVYQAAVGTVLLVSFLVVFESSLSWFGLDTLVNVSKSTLFRFPFSTCFACRRLGPTRLWHLFQGSKLTKLELFASFSLCHLLNEPLVIFEVGSVQGFETWDPDLELCSELLIKLLVLKNWVAGILHQVKVLQWWASFREGLNNIIGIVELIVAHGENCQLGQLRHSV